MTIELSSLPLPAFGLTGGRPEIPVAELEQRMDAAFAATGADWVVVYGDREHFANMTFLCGFDPRFEEALLLLSRDARILVVGLEGLVYAGLLSAAMDVRLCPAFGLMGQDRTGGQPLHELLADAGVSRGQTVGVVGWKSLGAGEWSSRLPALAAPAFVVDALRELVGDPARVTDATPVLMAADGLRARNSASQLAAFEWASARASLAVRAIQTATRPGWSEHDAVAAMGYAGEPLSAHVMFSSGPQVGVGLRSAVARSLERGDAVTTAVGYWGGLSSRAGILAAGADDLTAASDGFLEQLAIPYWSAIAAWWEALRIGGAAGDLHAAVQRELAGVSWGPSLNPGHLVHLDEWLVSPVYPGSTVPLASGMAWQVDVIPDCGGPGMAANCEDGVALADDRLRAELAESHPETAARIDARRGFMREGLGLEVADEVLPLSAMPAYFAPFWLAPETVFIRRG
jgi:hypothetical protein